MKCPGYKGKWWWWGRCCHVFRYGLGWLTEAGSIEYLCGHPKGENNPCPTKGKKPK